VLLRISMGPCLVLRSFMLLRISMVPCLVQHIFDFLDALLTCWVPAECRFQQTRTNCRMYCCIILQFTATTASA
jgi:hypothetical protein